jgi:hypothetical protein
VGGKGLRCVEGGVGGGDLVSPPAQEVGCGGGNTEQPEDLFYLQL